MGTSVTAPEETATATAHVSLGVLGAAAFIVTANARAIDPLLPTIAAEFAVSVGRAALIVTSYAVPYGLCQLLYGPLGDRVGKPRVMRPPSSRSRSAPGPAPSRRAWRCWSPCACWPVVPPPR